MAKRGYSRSLIMLAAMIILSLKSGKVEADSPSLWKYSVRLPHVALLSSVATFMTMSSNVLVASAKKSKSMCSHHGIYNSTVRRCTCVTGWSGPTCTEKVRRAVEVNPLLVMVGLLLLLSVLLLLLLRDARVLGKSLTLQLQPSPAPSYALWAMTGWRVLLLIILRTRKGLNAAASVTATGNWVSAHVKEGSRGLLVT